jgi:hypothetical protein
MVCKESALTVCSRPDILGSSNAVLRAKGETVVMVVGAASVTCHSVVHVGDSPAPQPYSPKG